MTMPTPAPELAADIDLLYQQHHDMILRTAWRLTGNMKDAEDVLHTVFVTLLQQPQALSAGAVGGPYLHRAAVNAALDVLRQRQRLVPLEALPAHLEAKDETVSEQVLQTQLLAHLRSALARLSPRAAEVFVLRHVEGYSNREIGRLLGISWGSVAVIAHRARRHLQRELATKGRL